LGRRVPNDTFAVEKQIAERAPGDLAGYRKFLRYSEEVFKEGYEKLAHVPFPNFWSMASVVPQLVRLEAYRSVYGMVSKYIQDPHLRQLVSFHSLLVGGNPFTTTSIYTLIHCLERKWGVYFPKGGTGALVQALTRLFRELGGEIRLGCEISEIVTSGAKVSGVTTRDGSKEGYDWIVSNADVVHTYQTLLRRELRGQGMAKKLGNMRHSMSLFLIYFGTRRKYPGLAHHNIIFGPRYRELLRDIFQRGQLAEDFSLYLHAPTRSDPELAPPGCDTFYVLSPVPHLGKLKIDWDDEGPHYADRILRYLEARYMPDLRNSLVTTRIFTPKDFQSELNAHLGSAFSLEPRLTQSAYFRVHNRDRRLRGLYFVGAGTHPGAGIPGVINSAKATAGLMLDDLRAAVARNRQTEKRISYA
jgi:phytoene desaturase